jgi:hypothetical protein
MKHLFRSGLSLGLLVSLAGSAHAQFGPQYQLPSARPAISPWLNLLRGGASPANNYFNLVRPEQDFGSNIYQLQGQTQANRAAINNLEYGPYAFTTGHRSGFMTQGRYFMNNGSGSPAGVLGARAGISGIGGGAAARAGFASQVGSPNLGSGAVGGSTLGGSGIPR